MKPKIIAIIQARMGSTRLPGKVLLPILGRPMLWYIVSRLKTLSQITDVIVATSKKSTDDAIAKFCEDSALLVYRGSEEDVLDRFYNAAKLQNANYVIRVTADCPLIDPTIVNQLIIKFFKDDYDYCGVATGAGVAQEGFTGRFPDGLDAEIFTFLSLEQAWRESIKAIHREHVTPFIWQQPNMFKISHLKSKIDYSNIRLTVDNSQDFELIRWIYEELYPKNPNLGLQDVIHLLQKNREKLNLNNQSIGKEGYEEFWK